MVPKFSSQTDMIGFLKALPENAAYDKMLREDFGFVAPDDAPAYQKQYFFKYLIQGQYLGKSGEDLTAYARDKVLEFADRFRGSPTVWITLSNKKSMLSSSY